jgi:hypothetical protein
MPKNVLQAAMFSRVRYYLVTWLPHPVICSRRAQVDADTLKVPGSPRPSRKSLKKVWTKERGKRGDRMLPKK